MIAGMTVAGFAIRRIFPPPPIARGAGWVALLLVMGALVWFSFFRRPAPNDADTVLSAQQTALAHYVARDIEYKLAERADLLNHMASTLPLALLDHPTQLRRWLAEQQRPPALFTQGMLVANTSGRTVGEYPQRTERTPLRHDGRDYLRGALAGELTIGRPVSGLMANESVLPMAVAVKDATGTVRAVLIGMTALHAPGFLTLNPQHADDEDTDFLLVSPADRLLLASTQAKQVMQSAPTTGVDTVLDRAMDGFRGSDTRVNAAGVEEVTAVAAVPRTDWFVLARHAGAGRHGTAFGTGINRLVSLATVLLLVGASWWVWQRRTALAHPLGLWQRGFARLMAGLRGGTAAHAHAAYHDALTGLPNSALLADRLGQALARAQRNSTRVGLVHINLDQFTALNARLGMEAGNAALAEIARRLTAIVRETDTLARVEGDTFVVLLGELDSGFESARIAACAVAAKCLDAVAPALTLNAQPYQLGASVGIALSTGQADPDALQSAAARAMYHAKQLGGDRYFVDATMPASPAMASA